MHAQVAERAARLSGNGREPLENARCGVLAVTSGAGMRQLFESFGASAIDGGPTLNPSTYELLAGIHDVPAEEVIVLPNSANVIMAADRAAELSEKVVLVVPTKSQQAGLTAAVALDPARAAEQNGVAMHEAIVELRIGSVAPAARDDLQGRFVSGDAVGFVEDEIIAWGEPQPTLESVLSSLAREAELLTCISGEGAPISDAVVEGMAPDGVEFEMRVGGQPAYWWLLAAE
jgi:dihydroxyacetone kinase-like predicted kinase